MASPPRSPLPGDILTGPSRHVDSLASRRREFGARLTPCQQLSCSSQNDGRVWPAIVHRAYTALSTDFEKVSLPADHFNGNIAHVKKLGELSPFSHGTFSPGHPPL